MAQSGVKSIYCVYNNADSVTNNDTAIRLSLEHCTVTSCISFIKAKCNRARWLGHWFLDSRSSGSQVPCPVFIVAHSLQTCGYSSEDINFVGHS